MVYCGGVVAISSLPLEDEMTMPTRHFECPVGENLINGNRSNQERTKGDLRSSYRARALAERAYLRKSQCKQTMLGASIRASSPMTGFAPAEVFKHSVSEPKTTTLNFGFRTALPGRHLLGIIMITLLMPCPDKPEFVCPDLPQFDRKTD
jgi:hypothetical protein